MAIKPSDIVVQLVDHFNPSSVLGDDIDDGRCNEMACSEEALVGIVTLDNALSQAEKPITNIGFKIISTNRSAPLFEITRVNNMNDIHREFIRVAIITTQGSKWCRKSWITCNERLVNWYWVQRGSDETHIC